jgi:hypothetical protein
MNRQIVYRLLLAALLLAMLAVPVVGAVAGPELAGLEGGSQEAAVASPAGGPVAVLACTPPGGSGSGCGGG